MAMFNSPQSQESLPRVIQPSVYELPSSAKVNGVQSMNENSQPQQITADQPKILQLKESEYVYRQGDQPLGLYFIKSGSIKIVTNRSLKRGRMASPDFISQVVGSGNFFGYTNVITGQPHTSYAKALKPTEILVYSLESVRELMNGPDSIAKSLLLQTVKDSNERSAIEQLHYLASVQERIAYQLLLLSDRFGVDTEQGRLLSIKLTRNELAQLAGTINESLSRHLTELKNEGILDLVGKEIIIKDRNALMQKSGNFNL